VRIKIRRRKKDKGTKLRKKVAGAQDGVFITYYQLLTYSVSISPLQDPFELTRLEISSAQIPNATSTRCVKTRLGRTERERDTAAEETKMRVHEIKKEKEKDKERA